MPPWKLALLKLCYEKGVFKFETTTLKSGRISPYFILSSNLDDGQTDELVGNAYAAIIRRPPALEFDVLFGAAYKGIPIVVNAARSLKVCRAFNRIEAKKHGEGGILMGAIDKLERKETTDGNFVGGKVVIIDDVITAGTAMREVMEILNRATNGQCQVAAVVVMFDRQECMGGTEVVQMSKRKSVLRMLKEEYNIPEMRSVLCVDDLIAYLKFRVQHSTNREEIDKLTKAEQDILKFREDYGFTDSTVESG